MPSKVLSGATSGVNEVIPGVAGKCIRVYGYVFQAAGDVNVKWQYGIVSSGGSYVDLTGAMPNVANSGVCCPNAHEPYFTLPAGKSLYANLSAAVQVSGHVTYSQF
jgi:hypothetical protein